MVNSLLKKAERKLRRKWKYNGPTGDPHFKNDVKPDYLRDKYSLSFVYNLFNIGLP